MVPTHFKLGDENYKFADLQFQSHVIQDLGVKQILVDLTQQNIGRLGLNNTPEFLKSVEITTLLHSRILKTQSYCEYKEFFEGTVVKDFGDITSDRALQQKLKAIYKNVENVDYYIGLLAEDHPERNSIEFD
jgi:prostaglandin-endoperoxide synthase 2